MSRVIAVKPSTSSGEQTPPTIYFTLSINFSFFSIGLAAVFSGRWSAFGGTPET
jgi:hypothetical protein